jgi:site-specific DNA-methyltransferase (adenine-specific)
MEEGAIDAFVCDPPYGLEFMGKEWDAPWKFTISDHGFSDGADRLPAPNFSSNRNPICRNCGKRQRTWKGGPEACSCGDADFDNNTATEMKGYQGWCITWLAECYRVLPSGGIIKAFSGTRTYHRLAAAMEVVGFVLDPSESLEAWSYGSGFPKSLNISKAIDKMVGAEREVLQERTLNNNFYATNGHSGESQEQYRKREGGAAITAPATDDAKRFEGYGTALKPAWEPVLVGRKP